MRTLVILSFFIFMVRADSSNSQEIKQKTTQNSLNTITPVQKPEVFHPSMRLYHPALQAYAQPQYVQIIPKSAYMLQQPHAMIIIAQPAFVPQSVIYGGPAQLLNYLHGNPQARYLPGNYHAQPQIAPQASVGNYIISAPPQYQQYHVPQQFQSQQFQSQQLQPQQLPTQHLQPQQLQPQSVQPQQSQPQQSQLTGIAQLAQLAAQYATTTPLRMAPALVTGFENFSPEQQAQIKSQLGAHLGSNFQILPGLKKEAAQVQQSQQKYGGDYSAPKFGDFTQKFSNEFSSQKFGDFIASQPAKSEVTTSASMPGDILKTQYTKG